MKHLLFLLDFYPPHRGGIENVFHQLISRLVAQGYEVSLVTSRFDKDLPREEHTKSFHLYRCGQGRVSFFFFGFFKAFQLLRAHPEIEGIHSSTYTSAIPASILGFLFKKKRILTVHEMFGKLWKCFKSRWSAFWYQWYEKVLFLFPQDAYHCVSLYTLNTLRVTFGIDDTKLHLIYNGVDQEFWREDAVKQLTIAQWKEQYHREGKKILLYYGHTGKSKGIDTLVQGLVKLLVTFPDIIVVFNLIPSKRDQEIKQKIKEQAKKSGYSDRVVIFSGWDIQQLRELVACADWIIAPSLAEGFGSVHSEVCSMGKPLITTRVAAIPEVVSGKVVFMTPGDVGDLVNAIEKVKKQEFENLPPKSFSREKSVEEIEKMYE